MTRPERGEVMTFSGPTPAELRVGGGGTMMPGVWVRPRRGRANGHETNEREIAAAIGVSLAMALKSGQPVAASAYSPWRLYGRREQLLSRTLGNRGWQ